MYTKILVPLDGSELTECSLDHVDKAAAGGGLTEVIFLRVVEPISSNDASAWAQAGYMLSDVEKKTLENAQKYLSQIVQRFTIQGLKAKAEVITGRATESIIDYAVKNNVDLIIVSSHGRSGITRFALGSVADKLVRHSPVPVLVVSPAGCRARK